MKEQARDHIDRKLSEFDGAPAEPTGALSGEFVTEAFEYEGGRRVPVYVPAGAPEAIVVAADGEGISKRGGLLEKAEVPSTGIVVSRRVEIWPSLLGCGIRMFTVQSSAPRLAAVTSRLALCRVRFRAHILCRHTGAVLPWECKELGGRAARCRCGCRHEGSVPGESQAGIPDGGVARPFFCATHTLSSVRAAGVTPGMRLAWPMVCGRILPSFSCISRERPETAS
jgi:hypothetical protein